MTGQKFNFQLVFSSLLKIILREIGQFLIINQMSNVLTVVHATNNSKHNHEDRKIIMINVL